MNRDVSIAAIRVYDELLRKEAEERPRKKRRKIAKDDDVKSGVNGGQATEFEGLKILEGLSASGTCVRMSLSYIPHAEVK